MPQNSRPLLAIDLGRKRFGVALCTLGTTIIPIAEIDVDQPHASKALAQVASLVAEYDVAGVVIGLPLNNDGTLSETAKKQSAYREKLQELISVPLDCIDEYASTIDGVHDYPGVGKDAAAAMAILSQYIEARRDDEMV